VIRRVRAAFQAESVATPHGFQGAVALWSLGLLRIGAAVIQGLEGRHFARGMVVAGPTSSQGVELSGF
jgi:hypothetical protein